MKKPCQNNLTNSSISSATRHLLKDKIQIKMCFKCLRTTAIKGNISWTELLCSRNVIRQRARNMTWNRLCDDNELVEGDDPQTDAERNIAVASLTSAIGRHLLLQLLRLLLLLLWWWYLRRLLRLLLLLLCCCYCWASAATCICRRTDVAPAIVCCCAALTEADVEVVAAVAAGATALALPAPPAAPAPLASTCANIAVGGGGACDVGGHWTAEPN